jgi:hypothetical protein
MRAVTAGTRGGGKAGARRAIKDATSDLRKVVARWKPTTMGEFEPTGGHQAMWHGLEHRVIPFVLLA